VDDDEQREGMWTITPDPGNPIGSSPTHCATILKCLATS
jgi:hypothetical protein